MKNFLFLLLWLATASHSFAQTATNQPLLDYFENLDVNQVGTGILKERGFPVFDMDFYNGQTLTNENRVDANNFGWLYLQLMLGNVNTNATLPDPQVYMNQYSKLYSGSGSIPIAVLNYQYNYIKSDALSQNLVYVSNGKMYDTPNRTSSPYGEATLFAATTLVENSYQSNVSFTIPNDLYLTNQSSALQTLEMDLDDGSGFRTTALGSSISTSYWSNGLKTLKIKATLANGTVLQSHTTLTVDAPNNNASFRSPPTSYNDNPDLEQTVSANIVMGPSATLSFFFHCPSRGLQKPFIFIEGFNPSELQNDNFEAMKRRLRSRLNIGTNPEMWQRLYDEGYDLIYVDFTDGAGDIIGNAQVVKQAIRNINSMKQDNRSVEKTRVLGASMGGIVGKWALREMEINNEAHDVDKFISFDSPLKGANVPLGVQFLIQDIANRSGKVVVKSILGLSYTVKSFSFSEFVPLVQNFVKVFNKPATKQMIFYNAWAPTNNRREFHDAFYNQFDALGDLQQIEHIKISNGSSTGRNQLLDPGERYAQVIGLGTTPQRIGIGRTSIDIGVNMNLQVFAMPTSGTGTVYDGRISLFLPFGINVLATIQMTNNILGLASGLKPFDSASGGFENFGFPDQVDRLSFDNVRIMGDFGTKTNGLWGFVPTFSALGLPEPANVLQTSSCISNECLASIDASAKSLDVLLNGGFAHNQGHVTINQRNYDFLLNRLNGPTINFTTVGNALTRIFNFGASSQVGTPTQLMTTSTIIDKSVTIQNNAAIWINRAGKIAFTDENNLINSSNSTFTTWVRQGTSECQQTNTNVVVNNGGTLHLGDPSVTNIGILGVQSNCSIQLFSGSNLRIEQNSQLIVESGGKLIIEAGANINLVGANSRIVIRDGGELILKGDVQINGSGHFRFEQGNIFTLNNSLLLRGTSRNHTIIRIALNTTVQVTNPFELRLEDATVLKESGTFNSQRHIWLKNGATLRANNVLFDDQTGWGNQAAFVEVEDPFDIDSDPNDVDYEFINCRFQNNQTSIKLFVPYAMSDINDRRDLNLEFRNCEFIGGQALYADRSYITHFDNCTLTNANMEVRTTYWLNIQNTRINGSGSGTAIKTAKVGHFWFRENSLISQFTTGIDASEAPNFNIIMTESTIRECFTGILLNGFRFGPNDDIGLLHMDCARMIQNVTAIKGTDIIFSVYTRWNATGETANIFTKNQNDPSGFHIQSLFDKRWNETDVWLHGNFWNDPNPIPTTTNNPNWDFRMKRIPQNPNEPWDGTIHIDPVRTVATDGAVVNCGGTNLRNDPNHGASLRTNPNDPLDSNTIVNVNGIYRNVKIQQDAGWRKLSQKNLKEAIALMQPVAGLSSSITDTASNTVNHLVDVAKCFTISRGAQSRSTTKQDGWLPETFVGYVKPKENTFAISPNPTADQFDITLPKGDYTLQIFDVLGKLIFSKNTEGSSKVDVHAWQNGIYMVSLLDKSNKKKTFSKIVVQH